MVCNPQYAYVKRWERGMVSNVEPSGPRSGAADARAEKKQFGTGSSSKKRKRKSYLQLKQKPRGNPQETCVLGAWAKQTPKSWKTEGRLGYSKKPFSSSMLEAGCNLLSSIRYEFLPTCLSFQCQHRSGFLNLRSVDIWGWINLCCGGPSCAL